MKTNRRKALMQLTAGAVGLNSLTGDASSTQAQPKEKAREAVTGVGGFFFRAHDPKLIADWYRKHLGIELTPKSYNDPVWTQEAGPTVFTPFPESTGYFGDPAKQWLINFRVRDLEKLSSQLEGEGIAVKRDPAIYPNGRFARIHDPEGNPIELWQPVAPAARK